MELKSGFMMIEIIIVLLIITIISTLTLKNIGNGEEVIIQKASKDLQLLQNEINKKVIKSYLNKESQENLDKFIEEKTRELSSRNKYNLEYKKKYLQLRINKHSLKLIIKKGSLNIIIGCNPNNNLCKKLYSRKLGK